MAVDGSMQMSNCCGELSVLLHVSMRYCSMFHGTAGAVAEFRPVCPPCRCSMADQTSMSLYGAA